MSANLEYPQKHPISAEEYLRMGEAGVFAPEARLELIEGEIFEMAPIHPPHAGRVKKLNQLFVEAAGGRAIVSVQDPLIISNLSVPQPDLALLKQGDGRAARQALEEDIGAAAIYIESQDVLIGPVPPKEPA